MALKHTTFRNLLRQHYRSTLPAVKSWSSVRFSGLELHPYRCQDSLLITSSPSNLIKRPCRSWKDFNFLILKPFHHHIYAVHSSLGLLEIESHLQVHLIRAVTALPVRRRIHLSLGGGQEPLTCGRNHTERHNSNLMSAVF